MSTINHSSHWSSALSCLWINRWHHQQPLGNWSVKIGPWPISNGLHLARRLYSRRSLLDSICPTGLYVLGIQRFISSESCKRSRWTHWGVIGQWHSKILFPGPDMLPLGKWKVLCHYHPWLPKWGVSEWLWNVLAPICWGGPSDYRFRCSIYKSPEEDFKDLMTAIETMLFQRGMKWVLIFDQINKWLLEGNPL
jgi:hypothetical protein